jgi:YidC/Oxa1 family membrane protein insertase
MRPWGGSAAAAKGGSAKGAPAKGGSKDPAQPARIGLFGRGKATPEPAKPVIDTKALAPRPGAKPVKPKKGRPANKPQG